MTGQIICNVLISVNFVIYNIAFFLRVKNYGRNINKSKQPLTINKLCIEIFKIIGITSVALVVSSVSCILDGLSDEKYIAIPFVTAAVMGFLEWILLALYFAKAAKRHQIYSYFRPEQTVKVAVFFNRGILESSLILGIMHSVVTGQLVYTLILIFV